MKTLQRMIGCAAAGGAMVLASPALAGMDVPEFSMACLRNGVQEWFSTPDGAHLGGTLWQYEEMYESPTGWSMDYSAIVDTDPSIGLSFSFQNNTDKTQMFSVLATLILDDPITGDTVIGGSVGGSTTDASFDGSGGVSAPTMPASAFYNALVDGVVEHELHPALSIGYDFPGDTASIPDVDFGLPGPTHPGPVGASSIGIRIDFLLSPGDSVAVSSFFVLEPVPAPGALALLGVAGLAGSRRRRRN